MPRRQLPKWLPTLRGAIRCTAYVCVALYAFSALYPLTPFAGPAVFLVTMAGAWLIETGQPDPWGARF